ncbi:kinesin light chain-related protein 3, partial [Tanacetum coccineum]
HAYQKALTGLKSSKGENHPSVASVYVRLAVLYNKTGKIRDSKSYCENALRIYEKPVPGIPQEEIACGFTDVSAIYESMNELDQALKLLQKALKIYNDVPGQQNTVAGIEAQMGVMYYVLGKYSESYSSFKSAVLKLRASSEKKSAFFGIALNQMGLTCVQRYAINEALDLFEEAQSVLEHECGSYHPDTLAVYSNLAGTYDAVGRLDDAIAILERIVVMREEKLGTAHPDVDDEKRRLAELLKESGKVRTRKTRSLEHLLDSSQPYDLVVVNSFFKKRDAYLITFHSGDHDTQIDYMLVRRGDLRLCKDCKVFPGEVCFSQHRLLALDIHIKRRPRSTEMAVKPRILWKNLYGEAVEAFRARVIEGVTPEAEGRIVADAEQMWNRLANTIREAAKETLGVVAGTSRTRIGCRESWWISDEVQDKVKAKQTRFREHISMRGEDEANRSAAEERYKKAKKKSEKGGGQSERKSVRRPV